MSYVCIKIEVVKDFFQHSKEKLRTKQINTKNLKEKEIRKEKFTQTSLKCDCKFRITAVK